MRLSEGCRASPEGLAVRVTLVDSPTLGVMFHVSDGWPSIVSQGQPLDVVAVAVPDRNLLDELAICSPIEAGGVVQDSRFDRVTGGQRAGREQQFVICRARDFQVRLRLRRKCPAASRFSRPR